MLALHLKGKGMEIPVARPRIEPVGDKYQA
jgi:hypothetical protein